MDMAVFGLSWEEVASLDFGDVSGVTAVFNEKKLAFPLKMEQTPGVPVCFRQGLM